MLLPAWKQILQDLDQNVTNLPRDVATRWNSTYDMLAYVLTHREAVDVITQRRDLRKFELGDHEWGFLEELHDVLKVITSMVHSECGRD